MKSIYEDLPAALVDAHRGKKLRPVLVPLRRLAQRAIHRRDHGALVARLREYAAKRGAVESVFVSHLADEGANVGPRRVTRRPGSGRRRNRRRCGQADRDEQRGKWTNQMR